MLWDLIRDFFVEHIFGGMTSSGSYLARVGNIHVALNGVVDDEYMGNVTDLFYKVSTDGEGHSYYLSLGDWLSTTATAISITIIVVLCCLFVYKIIRLIGGLIR